MTPRSEEPRLRSAEALDPDAVEERLLSALHDHLDVDGSSLVVDFDLPLELREGVAVVKHAVADSRDNGGRNASVEGLALPLACVEWRRSVTLRGDGTHAVDPTLRDRDDQVHTGLLLAAGDVVVIL